MFPVLWFCSTDPSEMTMVSSMKGSVYVEGNQITSWAARASGGNAKPTEWAELRRGHFPLWGTWWMYAPESSGK
jgi:hypothetical protein